MIINQILQPILFTVIATIIKSRILTVSDLNNQHSKDVILETKAEQILSFMNQKVDPCDDFYEFACGNFGTFNFFRTTFITGDAIDDAMYKKKKLEMEMQTETESDDAKDLDIHKTMKNFHSSCINARTGNAYESKLKNILMEFGKMPVLEGDKWQENEFDWLGTVAHIAFKTGQYSILNINPVEDLFNSSITRVEFGPPEFAMPRALYIDESLSRRKKSRATRMANDLQYFLGVEEKLAKATAEEMLDFESSLARGTIDPMLDTPPDENVLDSTDNIQEKYLPVWNTKQFFQDAIGFVPIEAVAIHQYLEHAQQVLKETPKRIVANYVYYMLLSKFTYNIKDTPKYRELVCMSILNSNFYKHLMNLLYGKYFDEQTKNDIDFLWQELKSTWLNKLESSPRLNWMQKDTRQNAIEKMQAMKLRIAYFEDANDADDFVRLQLKSHDYVYNMKSVMHLKAQQTRAKFHQPTQQEMPVLSSPFNYFNFNYVGVPLEMLQPFYAWSSSYPYAYNFGSLGSVLAHEIMHGFDNYGRKFDGKGNIHNWWDSESENEFLSRKQCFVNQYKSYIYGGRALPVMQAQGENIADNGGVRLAFEAYKTWYKSAAPNVTSESFPGLDYSKEQLFFLSYAQDWCASPHPDFMAEVAAYDTHAPEKFRVIGSLSNFDEFSKSFNCPKGSKMNPINKCEIY